jgi:hypothetical protein
MVEMADDGAIGFRRIPAGDYTWRLGWPGGFIEPEASDTLPQILRGVFSVTADGIVGTPDPLPGTWPESIDEALNVDSDRIVIGRPPEIVLLGMKDPAVLAVSPSSGGNVIASGVGTLDVSVALLGSPRQPVTAPDVGSGAATDVGEGWPAWVLPLVALLALAAAGSVLGVRHRR